jgi:hypothetical protein
MNIMHRSIKTRLIIALLNETQKSTIFPLSVGMDS